MKNFTVIVPTRNNEFLANSFLNNILRESELDIILIDDNSDLPIKYIQHDRISIINNKQKKSLSSLWNQGVKLSKTENVIICSHKVRPNKNDFLKMKDLLDQFFGLVALSGFHFFSFNKFLCTKIGMFDEGFTTGWFEDNDFLNKLVVNNISYYLSEEVHDLKGESGWINLQSENRNYYFSKWDEKGDLIVQKKNDVNYNDKFFYKNLNYTINYTGSEKTVHKIHSYKRYYKHEKTF
jgi:hypothetical protein